MLRKLILLGLLGGGAAWAARNRDKLPLPGQASSPFPPPSTDRVDPGPDEPTEQAATEDEAVMPEAIESTAETMETDAVVMPDTSADDPLVRQQEKAAAAAAGAIGGEADTVTANLDPATRPVVEGSGDAEETFEQIEDEGR